jgi:STE24 endopeptidase
LTEDKSTIYHRLRRRAELASTLAAGAVLLTLLLTGASVFLREKASFAGQAVPGFEETATAAVFGLIVFVLLAGVELPFAFYQGFTLEHRYGLSNQSQRRWVVDHGKGAAVGAVFMMLGVTIVYALLGWSPEWWWAFAAIVFAVLMVGMAQLAPVILLPLFYAFKPLDRPALVSRLVALADRARTPVVGVYEWALSAHTKKANAALAGMGRTRRILIADTLLADYTDDEIEVVLAHELSHHVHHDLWRGMALQTVLLAAGFVAMHLALTRSAGPLGLRGTDDPAGLPLLLLVGGACSLLFMPVANALSRAHERRADRYALDATRQPEAFISAMKRLSQQNLAEQHPSALVEWLFYSHPPIRQRIDAARAWTGRSGSVEGEVA